MPTLFSPTAEHIYRGFIVSPPSNVINIIIEAEYEYSTSADDSIQSDWISAGVQDISTNFQLVHDGLYDLYYDYRCRVRDTNGKMSDWSDVLVAGKPSGFDPSDVGLPADAHQVLLPDTLDTGLVGGGNLDAVVLAPGSLTNNNFSANTINANFISSGTIFTGLMTAGTINADRLVAHSVSAQQLDTISLSAGSVLVGSAVVGSIAAGAIVAGNVDAAAINGLTITGAIFRTAASTPWVRMDSTGVYAQDASGNVTFKADASTGKIITLAGIGGANLLRNAGFEDVIGITPWSIYQNVSTGTLAVETTASNVYNGKQAAKITVTGSGGQVGITQVIGTAAAPAFQGGQRVVGSVYAKSSTARNITINYNWYDSSDNLLSQASTITQPIATTYARHVANTVTVPTNTAYCRFYVWAETATNGDVYYLDGVQVEFAEFVTGYAPKPDEILTDQVGATELQALSLSTPDSIIYVGGVPGGAIAVNSIAADRIVARSITANQIAAGSITATEINVNTITALGTITAGSFIGTTFSTDILTHYPRVVLDSTGFYVQYNSTTKSFFIDSAAGNVTFQAGTGGSNKITWNDNSSNTRGELFTYIGGQGSSAILKASSASGAAHSELDILEGSAALSITSAGGTVSQTLLDYQGNSDFLKLNNTVDRAVVAGEVDLDFSSSNTCTQKTITHNLGRTPTHVWVTRRSNAAPSHNTTYVAGNYGSSTFTIDAYVDAAITGTHTVEWIAMG